jgi:hypothetical protein
MKKIFNICLFVALSFYLLACGGSSSGSSDGELIMSNSTNQCSLLQEPGPITDTIRIIQGAECSAANSPVVLVSVAPPGDFADICTGILITPNVVLTAAHCMPGSLTGVNVFANGRSIPISRILIHPAYRIDTVQDLIFYDVALVYLSQPTLNNTLPLVTSRLVSVGEPMAIFGYGLDELGVQGVLRSGLMTISDVTETHISAQFTGRQSNTCGGDSGGPAVQRFIGNDGRIVTGVIGTLSSGIDSSCAAGDVSTYININSPEIIAFIISHVPNVGLI